MNKPVNIGLGEWWYKGNIIQQNAHPRLLKYSAFPNHDVPAMDDPRPINVRTMTEAIAWCNEHPCKDPDNQAEDFLK